MRFFLSILTIHLFLCVFSEPMDSLQSTFGNQHYGEGVNMPKPQTVLQNAYKMTFGRVKRLADNSNDASIDAEIEELKQVNAKDEKKLEKLQAAVEMISDSARGSGDRSMDAHVHVAASESRLDHIFGQIRAQLNTMRSAAMRSADRVNVQITAKEFQGRMRKMFQAVEKEMSHLRAIKERSVKG